MRISILVLFVVVSAFSCKDNDDNGPKACGYSDPTVMPWLKARINSYKGNSLESTMYVQQGELTNGGYVFWLATCCQACDFMMEYYDCDGEKIEPSPFLSSSNPVINIKVIWKGENFECQLD
jgi:hypothetical protein